MQCHVADQQVKRDFVAVVHQADRATDRGFRGTVHTDRPVGHAGNARVGDERDAAVQLGHGERSRGDQDFRHAAGHRADIAQHDHVARSDAFRLHGVGDGFGIVETNRSATESRFLQAGDFEHDAAGRQIAKTDLHVGIGFERLLQGGNQGLARGRIRHARQVLGQRLAADRQAVPVQQARLVKLLEQHRRAADAVQIDHGLSAARGKATEYRRAAEDRLDVLQGELDACLAGQRQQVQDAVGRAADGGDRGRGVFEGLPRQHVARADVTLQQVLHGLADAQTFLPFLPVDGRDGTAVRQHQPDGFHRDAPGVERCRDAASAGSGTSVAQDLVRLPRFHGADGYGGLCVVDVQDRNLPARMHAGQNGPAADQQARIVHAGQGHGEPWAVLVAVVQADQRVVAVGADHALGPVGDQVAGGQAGIAAFVPLGDVVADGGDAERETDQAGLQATFRHAFRQVVGVHVAEIAVQQRHADADLRPIEVRVGQPQAIIKCRHSALPAVGQLAAIPVQIIVHRVDS